MSNLFCLATKTLCPDGTTAFATCQIDSECSDGFSCVRIIEKSYCCRQRLTSNMSSRVRQQYISYQTASKLNFVTSHIT